MRAGKKFTRALALILFLALAACDRVWILDDLNDAGCPLHEVAAETGGVWRSGGIAVVNVRLTEPGSAVPLAGRVAVEMDGRRLARVETDASGRAELEVSVPEGDGRHSISIWSKTRFNTRRDALAVEVRQGHRLFFSLDRPLAQPGQAVHLRALAFRPDGAADAGREVTFEVHDPGSNRVFRETAAASQFGVAHAAFQLADEITLGAYRATARAGPVHAEQPFSVKRYTLPLFRIEVIPEKTFVLPRETVRGSIRASYVFGNPVTGKVVVHADVSASGEIREIARIQGAIDSSGRSDFSFELAGAGSLLRITAVVTDGVGRTESAALILPIVSAPLLLHAVPLSTPIAPGLENPVAVFVTGPDGGPVEAEVSGGDASQRTDALGMATLVTRRSSIHLTARDAAGRSAERDFEFPAGGSAVVRPARRSPRAGAALEVEVRAARDGPCRVRLLSERGIAGQHDAAIVNGRGNVSLLIPSDLDGLAIVEAGGASAPLWVRGTRRLKVEVQSAHPVVKPGDDVTLRFRVSDGAGRPVPAALGVSVLDEALWGLAEIDPESALAAFATGGIASGNAARALWSEEDDARAEAAAILILASRVSELKTARFESRRNP